MGGTKKKIVILGGGQAALTAAFQLTHPSNPRRDEYEVTVYSIGWRLGGKGAAGRSLDAPFYYRIEEHGLHNWFGFYDNSFRQIRDCYAELGRAPDAPLATWEQAFVPANEAVFTEEIDGRHVEWVIHNPPNAETPGSPGLLLPLWEYVAMAIEAMLELWPSHAPAAGLRDTESNLAGDLLSAIEKLGVDLELVGRDPGERLLRVASKAARVAAGPVQRLVLSILRHFVAWLWGEVKDAIRTNDDARHLWILANFGYGCIAGAIEADVFTNGFDVLNEENFRPWLARHAFDDGGVMLQSPLVRAVYDSSFAYENGDTRIPPGGDHPVGEAYEAGTALRGMVRATFTYKGAFGWRFAAGTADTCYAPMYLVLKARGVRFELFHRVVSIEAGTGPGKPIERIVMARQVNVRANVTAGYDPLIDVKGLPCWPSRPLWDQIEDGAKLAASGVDLEQPPPDFVDAGQVVLEKSDFDAVVLGISIAALPDLCPSLFAASAKWQSMIAHVKTVRTEALQLWSKPTASQLGFAIPRQPIASWDYDDVNALNVWGDLSALLPFEGWPVEHWPQNVAYFCGAMPDDLPAGQSPKAYVRERAVTMLENGIGILWTKATRPDGGFDWDLLVDARPGAHVGAERIDSQYYRANVAPTERYVLSVPGSSKYRLHANDPEEFANLFLCGDWTWCNLNSGCMEAATMSGMLCALALSGFPARKDIVGVDFG